MYFSVVKKNDNNEFVGIKVSCSSLRGSSSSPTFPGKKTRKKSQQTYNINWDYYMQYNTKGIEVWTSDPQYFNWPCIKIQTQ